MYFTLSSHWYEKKDDEASPSIILAGRALLVKMLITLEPRYALVQILNNFFFFYIYLFYYFFHFFFFFFLSFFFFFFFFFF